MVPNFMWGEPPTRHYLYAIYYTFAILCFDVLVLIFVGRSWRSSGSQDWPKFDVGMAVRVGSARRSWRFLICLAGGLLFVNALLSLLPSFALPSALADGHRSLVDLKTLETDRYRPITIFNLEEVAKRFPRPSSVFWAFQVVWSTPLFHFFHSFPINIHQWCRETANKHQPLFSHYSAILQPFVRRLAGCLDDIRLSSLVFPFKVSPLRLGGIDRLAEGGIHSRRPLLPFPGTFSWDEDMYFEDVFQIMGKIASIM